MQGAQPSRFLVKTSVQISHRPDGCHADAPKVLLGARSTLSEQLSCLNNGANQEGLCVCNG